MQTDVSGNLRKVAIALGVSLLLLGCSKQADNAATEQGAGAGSSQPSSGVPAGQPDDVVADVGGEIITFSQLNTMLNSSAIVGLSVPAVGTTERNTVRIALLDKMISANLVYLDAIKQGADRDPVYLADIGRFADALLAALYRGKYLIGDIEVSDAEVQDFYKERINEGTELTDDVKLAIEASIRKEKLKGLMASLRGRLREQVDLQISDGIMDAELDAQRQNSDVMAMIDGEELTWGQVRPALLAVEEKGALMDDGLGIDTTKDRFEAFNRIVDNQIMAAKARKAGLEKDQVYVGRMGEFRKTRLINLHRASIIAGLEPTDEELQAYYAANRDAIRVPESRKLQMVVLKTREEAEQLKQRIEAGEMTLFEAARDFSIDPNAKTTLGDMGWVKKGTGFPDLDAATFALLPDELGGPVESPAGWHLLKVVDLRDSQYDNIEDENTRNVTRRRLLHQRLADYVVDLRKHQTRVTVYADQLDRLFKAEADWVNDLEQKASQPHSMTREREEELKKFMQQ